MDPRMRPAPSRRYEEFIPETRLISEEGAETLRVYLPDYKKEQLRVQLTSSRLLRISGERPLGGNNWQRFIKEAPVSPSCDTREITAKFEGGVLYVKQPKVITSLSEAPGQPKPIPAPAVGEPSGFAEAPNNVGGKKGEEQTEPSKLADKVQKCKEESRDKGESKGRRGLWNAGFYRELKKPGNLKMFAVIVVVAMVLALHASYVNRVCGPGKVIVST